MKPFLFLLIISVHSYSQINDKLVVQSKDQNNVILTEEYKNQKEENTTTNSSSETFINKKSFLNTINFYEKINSFLDENGFYAEINYKADFFSNLKGGLKNSSNYVDNFDIQINADFKKLFNWNDGAAKIQFLGINGGSVCDLVNASQGISNIEAYPTWKLYQFTFEKKISNKLDITIGLYDLNSEFDTRESSSIFLNPSHGIGDELAKSGINGPSIFPNTSLGLRLKYNFDDEKSLLIALLDGVAGNPENPNGTQIVLNKNDGVLAIGQYQLSNEEFIVSFGSWIYSSKTENFVFANKFENDFGFYLSAEKFNLFKNNINGFLRIGTANKSTNPSDYYIGSGLKVNDLYTDLNIEEIGFAIAITHNSSDFISKMKDENIFMRENEINFELTVLLKITEWLQIQPDFQYIINPTYCNLNQTAFVSGFRFYLKV